MLSPNSTMGDELRFQQRWEFRGKDNDFDSSSDSKSSSIGQPVLRKHKLASSLISLDDDVTSNIIRLERNHSGNPGFGDQLEFAEGKEKKIKRGRKKNFADGEVKRDCQDDVNRKKSKSIVYDPAAIDDVKNFRESLLEDLRVTRENLFTWMEEEMNKLVADDNGPKKGRRKCNSRGKKVQPQQQNNFKKNVKLQQQNSIDENVVQVRHQNNNGAIVHVQQQNNFEEDTEVQCHKSFKSGIREQKGIGGSSKRVTKGNESSETGDQVACGQATGHVTSLEKEKGERLALTYSSNVQAGPSNQNVRVQHSKSVVLAIRAQNCNDGSSDRSVKGKKTRNSSKHYQAPEERIAYGQAIGSLTSTGKDKLKRLRLSVEQGFPPNPTNQVASSMYLTLPTVLTKPHDSNDWLDDILSNYIQPRVSGNKTGVTLEGTKQMQDFSTHFGYLPNIQPDRNGNFSQIDSRNMSSFNHNGSQNSSTGTEFPLPLHQGISDGFSFPSQFLLQNIPQESGNTLGLRMNGGAITFSGGSYAFSENFGTSNLPSHSNYRADGRLMPYHIPSITNGYLFPK